MTQTPEIIQKYVKLNRIIFQAPDSDFKIMSVQEVDLVSNKILGEFTAKGQADLSKRPNDYFIMFGEWVEDPTYGKQFNTLSAYLPTSMKSMVKQLDRPDLKNVSKQTLEAVYMQLQPYPFERMLKDPECIMSVKKVSERRKSTLKDYIVKNADKLDELKRFFSLGFTFPEVVYITEDLNISYDGFSENPYQILGRQQTLEASVKKSISEPGVVNHMNFRRLDKIVINNNMDFSELERATYAANHAFDVELPASGDTVFPLGLARRHIGSDMLNNTIDIDIVEAGIKDNPEIVHHKDSNEYQSKAIYKEEQRINKHVRHLASKTVNKLTVDEKDAIRDMLHDKNGITYEDKQMEAIYQAIDENVSALTGGPGTGKTTTVKAIIQAVEAHYNSPVYCFAPTGKAAKRMTEAIGMDHITAKTIHTLIHSDWDKDALATAGASAYAKNEKYTPVYIIIDETSMVDTNTLASFLQRINRDYRILFVGDVDQLPPIGYGEPFKLLMDSDWLPKVNLQKIHRQADDSKIIDIAYAIRDKYNINFANYRTASDVTLEDRPAANAVIDYIKTRVSLGHDMSSTQIITPFRRNYDISSNVLNKALQPIMNPDHDTYRVKGEFVTLIDKSVLTPGDRIINVKNQVLGSAEVYIANGDTGTIKSVDPDKREIRVVLDSDAFKRTITIPKESLIHIELAYAITTHKSQGSEYKEVIIPLPAFSMPSFLTNNILYTAATRAKEQLTIFGEARIMNEIIQTDAPERMGWLEYMLEGDDHEEYLDEVEVKLEDIELEVE